MSNSTGTWLLNLVKQEDPLATPEKLLRLEVTGGEAVIWIITHAFNFIWKQRKSGKLSKIEEYISNISADVLLLKETKYSFLANAIHSTIQILTPKQAEIVPKLPKNITQTKKKKMDHF